MKKLNKIWVPKSRKERYGSIVVVWGLMTFFVTIFKATDNVIGVLGILATLFTIYALTQGSEALKHQDSLNRERRKYKRMLKRDRETDLKQKQKVIDEKIRLQKKGINPETGELCCPNCGHSDLTANRKGFTFLSGPIGAKKIFITCLRCGKRWKAGQYGR